MRILVTGKSGQLATALAEQAAADDMIELVALGRPELDLESPETVTRQVASYRPDVIINAAAYTAVDKAESEPARAMAVNLDGAAAVAHAAARRGVPLIHMSTDYVFDGGKTRSYVETDAADPLNVYGRSKLEGERAVLAAHPRALVLRTSWVFSPFGNNFVRTMLHLGAERPSLRVVNDQCGNPTSAIDLASAILAIAPGLRHEPGGLYHLTGQGRTTWHDFAAFVFQQSARRGGPAPVLEPISSAEYKAPARRPANSSLDCTAFTQRFGLSLRPWHDAVSETVMRCLSAKVATPGSD